MSSPTPGPDPDVPQGDTPGAPREWSAAPPPQDGSPAPDHAGSPAGHGPGAGAARPSQVLTAAVLGFGEALLLLLAALAYFAFASVVGFLALFGILYLALAIGCIWGGVLALQGKAGRILVVAAGVAAALSLIGLVLAAVGGAGFDTFSLLVLLLGAAIVYLLYQPQSKSYFAARSAR